MKIVNIKSREVLDSRGNPTVEVELFVENGAVYRSIVPSGASTGSRECLELRDKDNSRYFGQGVLNAVLNVNTIIRDNIIGLDVEDVDDLLIKLDNTFNKSKLGVNAILPVSLCCFECIIDNMDAKYYKEPLLMCNIINGGAHADNNLDIQEFMIIPKGKNILENIRMVSEIFHTLKKILKENNYNTGVGDEGGFCPDFNTSAEALDMMSLAIKNSNYVLGKDIFIGIDVAATQLFKDNKYFIDGLKLSRDEFIDYLIDLTKKYPIISIEDALHEDDFDGFKTLTEKIGDLVLLVGDDLFTTNSKYLNEGIKKGCCNSILIKPNQIGTVKEVKEVVELAKNNNYKIIFSHRSGDSEDSFIAKLACFFEADYVKFGSISRSDRTSKYNELIRIFNK